MLRNKCYPLEEAPLPSSLSFPEFLVCTQATKKATVLDKIDGNLDPSSPSPKSRMEKKQPRSQGSLLLERILVFAWLDSGKRGFQSISQLINQSINQSNKLRLSKRGWHEIVEKTTVLYYSRSAQDCSFFFSFIYQVTTPVTYRISSNNSRPSSMNCLPRIIAPFDGNI